MMAAPCAEDLNYWKTSRTGSDAWMDKAEALIRAYGGEVTGRASGRQNGMEAHLLRFRFGGDEFRALWPVLESKTGNAAAARVQAATMLYHDVKARAVRFRVFGARVAFFDWLCLPDGRPVVELAAPEIKALAPEMFAAQLLLTAEIVE